MNPPKELLLIVRFFDYHFKIESAVASDLNKKKDTYSLTCFNPDLGCFSNMVF